MNFCVAYYEYENKLKKFYQRNTNNLLVDGYLNDTKNDKIAVGLIKNPIRTFEVKTFKK